jgi:arylformamidase
MNIFDLTYDIENGMVHFKGDPIPRIKQVKSINKDGYNVKKIIIGTHTSTHVDSPSHFIENGKSVDKVDVFSYSGIVSVIDASKYDKITPELIKIVSNKKIFFYTGSNLEWNKYKTFKNYSYITKETAEMIVKKNVDLVGIDSPSIEEPNNKDFPAHKILLGNNVLIIENLNSIELKKLVGKVVFVLTLPLKIKEGDGSPARVIAFELP